MKRRILSAVRFVGRPPRYKSLRFDGPFSVRIDRDASFKLWNSTDHYSIETEFFWGGFEDAWESVSLGLWAKLCKGAEFILDVGACEGIYALAAKAIAPNARVIAFEPFPGAFERLEANRSVNKFDIELNRIALSDRDGTADFYTGGMTEGTLKFGVTPTSCQKITVPTRRLDSFLQERCLPRIDLIKIDVELFEPEVLRGMGEALAKFRPSIIVEILTDDVALEVEKMVEGLGYFYYDINDDGRDGRQKGYKRVERIAKSSCLNYLLVQKETAERLNLASG